MYKNIIVMDKQESMTPPKELWLVFDFTNLSLTEMKRVYQMIKNDTGVEKDILQLEMCYRAKKKEQSEEVQRSIPIPKMKKPQKISPPQKETVKKEPEAPGARKNLVNVPAPRQWWAFKN
jgi:hypothetical protein